MRADRRVDVDAVRDAAGRRDADPVDHVGAQERHPAAVGGAAVVVDQHDRLVERLGPRVVVEQRRGRGGVTVPGVQRGVAVERALERVVGAVVDHAHDAVVVGAADDPAGGGDGDEVVGHLDGQRLLGGGPDGVVGGQRQPEHALGRPVRGAGAGVGLRERPPRPVPAEGQQAVVVGHAVLHEVRDDAGRGAPQLPGRRAGHLRDRSGPEGCGRGEPVREAAALDQRAAVGSDEPDGVLQVPVEPRDVALLAFRGRRGPLHPRPEHGVQVHRPADVVVVGALVAVGEPAVRAHELLVQREVRLEVVGRPGAADGPQERLDDHPEPEPVGARVAVVADDGRQVVDDALLHAGVERVPQPGPGQVQDEGQRGRLDLRLTVLLRPAPSARATTGRCRRPGRTRTTRPGSAGRRRAPPRAGTRPAGTCARTPRARRPRCRSRRAFRAA